MAISIRLPREMEDKLRAFSAETGRSTSFYLKRIIEEHIDSVFDYYRADRIIKDFKSGKKNILTQEEFDREIGVDE